MSLYILVPKSGGFCGALRAFRGTREEAEDYFFFKPITNRLHDVYLRDEWDVLQLADGCLLDSQFKEVESSDSLSPSNNCLETSHVTPRPATDDEINAEGWAQCSADECSLEARKMFNKGWRAAERRLENGIYAATDRLFDAAAVCREVYEIAERGGMSPSFMERLSRVATFPSSPRPLLPAVVHAYSLDAEEASTDR